MTTDISNLVSAEARVLQFNEFINKNGFTPDVLMWDTPKVNPVVNAGGVTIVLLKHLKLITGRTRKRHLQKNSLLT